MRDSEDLKITNSLDAAPQFSLATFVLSSSGSSSGRRTPVLPLPADLLDSVHAWPPTFEALYLLADAEPHLRIPALTALTLLCACALARLGSAIPALLRGTPSLTALTLRLPPAALPAVVEALAGLRVETREIGADVDSASNSNPNSGTKEGASKAKVSAIPAPNLRALALTLTLTLAVPVVSAAASTFASARGVDVGKGKGRSLREEADWEAEGK
ncbi:hypothetical protein B0H11DRAFT_184283 [Mycena galericulata]|nr:hypothetical protein B0H11DRAFT_184283 [Mycena galericulata]